ncbi:LacI family DNA-binding transcriptional regulator [Paenibacillus sp. GCM10027626]|uniref:LacI family DNA-binding transcriptional regulator n=1 Tax=Paenibacillus sp. GCM10027626 TaxID=3273411 RepID=UPI003629194B
MKHTLESIARLAGVSRGTVSRIVNQQPGVKPHVREKVLQIIEQTGYVPHPQARSLAGGATGNIGVMVFSQDPHYLTHHLFYEVLQGIQTEAVTSDYDLLLFAGSSRSEQQDWKRAAIRRKVDGLIVMGEHIQEECLRYYRQQQIPFVLVGKRCFEQLPLACVTSDYYDGAYQAARHLLASGRRRIVYIEGLEGMYHEAERFRGFRQALEEAGVAADPARTIVGRADRAEAGRQMEKLLAKGIAIDAVFAANDLMAFGAIEVLQAAGLRIPEDVAVVGYDDIQAASYVTPPLTTVRQDKIRLGREATVLLMAMLRGELPADEEKDILIANELVVRGTL